LASKKDFTSIDVNKLRAFLMRIKNKIFSNMKGGFDTAYMRYLYRRIAEEE